MAQHHVGKKVVISLDIQSFFDSIRVAHIQEALYSYGVFGTASRVLAELCTYKFYVPQGALTSPKLSNIIAARTFGPKIKELADRHNLNLTIYADDITLSGDFPPERFPELLEPIEAILTEFGFRLNSKKTKVMTQLTRQWVCGVVVNDKVNMMRKERMRLRAIVHNIGVNGLESEALKNNIPPETFLSSIRGRVNWFRQLNPELGNKMMEKFLENIGESQPEPEREVDPLDSLAL